MLPVRGTSPAGRLTVPVRLSPFTCRISLNCRGPPGVLKDASHSPATDWAELTVAPPVVAARRARKSVAFTCDSGRWTLQLSTPSPEARMPLCRALLPSFVLAVSVASLGRAQSPADSASVQAFYAAWFGPASSDPARYASFYAPDGHVLPPNGLPVRGRDAIAEWQRKARAEASYTVRPEGMAVEELRFLGANSVV